MNADPQTVIVNSVSTVCAPDSWQLYVDTTHDPSFIGGYYDHSTTIDREAPTFSGTRPIGPWEPLGRGEWRRPLVRAE